MFEQAFNNIDDVLRKDPGCTTELDYTEQTSWLFFLKYLDGLEQDRADEAAMEDKRYSFILEKSIDPATFDLSVRNPNVGKVVKHRAPTEILDAESAKVLQAIPGLLV